MSTPNQSVASSTEMERDARLVSTDGHISPGELAIGVVIGRASESFDFFVYGIASVIVFPALMFPFADKLTGTLYAFAVFGLAFIARPFGSILFMEVDRRHGRGVKLTIALFLLGGSTAAIAFLPGYQSAGIWAVVALVVFRLGQGFALGGAWDGLASLLAMHAPEKHRAWYAMLPQLGTPIGFIIASSLFAFFYLNLAAEDFLGWGWRYPFFVAFTINVVALFARLRLIATEEYAELYESRDLTPVSVKELVANQGSAVLVGAFVPLASFALFHLVTIFPISYVDIFSNRSPGEFLLMQLGGAAICLVCILLSGSIADRIGRRTHLGACAIAIAIFSVATPFLLGGSSASQTAFIMIGFALLGLSHGQSAGAVASNFAGRDRYTGSALTTDLAWLIGAGFAPLVALGATSRFGLAAVGVYLLSGAVCTLIALRVNRQMRLRAV
ncbi:MFS transporter [Aureimonas phyllosphaerae]|uniref:MFS family permease n=1 Tax=Aureimonas phyllosphaerae TaxID=1166078 RepID=A0A7W6FTW4_9HYPH|nr:MFS transporter [Aureimonas phyllosphaerae]MBB3935609.1 MFS family permease [Aureimonas phyllosphaerae]MBB3959617.1 MFS family permease [Aureimonas phyllosphaerae]SFF12923.1 Predicted arabinose efflux permease, MFS family [Aureimonas phyllosphaerae]